MKSHSGPGHNAAAGGPSLAVVCPELAADLPGQANEAANPGHLLHLHNTLPVINTLSGRLSVTQCSIQQSWIPISCKSTAVNVKHRYNKQQMIVSKYGTQNAVLLI